MCQALRSGGQLAPVMFLTALGAVHDRLSGFGAGADDYLPKPFEPLELVARVEVLARRAQAVTPGKPSELILDPARHSMTCDGREVMLTPTEFRMLAAISSRPGEVVRRRAIAAAAWPSGGYVSDNTIDAYIVRLRNKMRCRRDPETAHDRARRRLRPAVSTAVSRQLGIRRLAPASFRSKIVLSTTGLMAVAMVVVGLGIQLLLSRTAQNDINTVLNERAA